MKWSKTIDRWSFFILGLAALALSTFMWTTIFNFLSTPNMQIVSWSIEDDVVPQDGQFTYNASYIKQRDCPGQWTIRATNANGRIYQIDTGRLGTRAPGTYSAEFTIDLPPWLEPGEYQVNEVIDGICDGGKTFVARGPMAKLTITGP